MNFGIDSNLLATALRIMNVVTDEVKLKCRKDCIRMEAVDPAHVMMAIVEIDTATPLVDGYEEDGSEHGLEVKNVMSILKRASKHSMAYLLFEEGQTVIEVDSMRNSMPELDTTGISDPKVPNLNLKSYAGLYSEELQKAMKYLTPTFGDGLRFEFTNSGLRISTNDDFCKMCYRIPKEESVGAMRGDASSLYPPDYIRRSITAIPKGTMMTIETDTKMPMRLGFYGFGFKGFYLIAPRIDYEAGE